MEKKIECYKCGDTGKVEHDEWRGDWAIVTITEECGCKGRTLKEVA